MGKSSSAKNNKHVLLKQSGFTFIEILIVTAVFFTFATAILNTLHPLTFVQKINDGRRKSDLARIQQALDQYYQKNGTYPASSSNFHIMNGKYPMQWGQDAWIPYLNLLPKDPVSNSREYVYYADSTNGNQSYWLYSSLEDPGDEPQACNTNCSLGNGAVPTNSCGVDNTKIICNYGVSSSNVSP